MSSWDAVVVGSGPNGLAAAIELSRSGCSVLVLEGAPEVGGGLRSEELTLPGFIHDSCASVLPLAAASPFFSSLPLAEYGLEWVVPEAPAAHLLEPDRAVILERSLEATAAGLGQDGDRWSRLLEPLVRGQEAIFGDLLGPLRIPRRPFLAARFGLSALLPATTLTERLFRDEDTRALVAGLAAHSFLPLTAPGSSAFALVLAMLAHSTGWPLVRGGSAHLARALEAYLRSLGGQVEVGRRVDALSDIPPSRFVLFDVTPRQLLKIAGTRLSPSYRSRLTRYRYGPGVCKVDFALSAPIPLRAGEARRAGTLHLGGTLEEVRDSERAVWKGRVSDTPFVLVVQASAFDASRSPPGEHTAWAYCHVPHGSDRDISTLIEERIESFAPGFRETILARSVRTASELEAYNPNLVGGDINGGVQDLRQLFSRPVASRVPYATSDPGIFLCSSSTPPGGGVHGLSGFHAARAALARHGRP